MAGLGRPRVNEKRDQLIYAYVEGELRKGLSQRRAFAKAAESGDFGAISAKAVESAYRKERDRQERDRQRRRQVAWMVAERVEHNQRFFAAATARNAQFLAAAAEASDLFRHFR